MDDEEEEEPEPGIIKQGFYMVGGLIFIVAAIWLIAAVILGANQLAGGNIHRNLPKWKPALFLTVDVLILVLPFKRTRQLIGDLIIEIWTAWGG